MNAFFCYLKRRRVPDRKLYLVFKIFKNCKISENCINLSALRNLKPVRKRREINRNPSLQTCFCLSLQHDAALSEVVE